jgi:hypothetical protein
MLDWKGIQLHMGDFSTCLFGMWKLVLFFENIFQFYFFKSYYFIKVYVKNLAKNVIFKKIQIHLQVFLKASVTMFNECFCSFFTHGLISNQFTCSHDIKNTII